MAHHSMDRSINMKIDATRCQLNLDKERIERMFANVTRSQRNIKQSMHIINGAKALLPNRGS